MRTTSIITATAIAGTLIALAAGPAFANPPSNIVNDLNEILDKLDALGPKTIFVSSTVHNGDLGGLDGADMICQGLADSVASIVPPGEYLALLTTSDVHAAGHITPFSGPFVRPDGLYVSSNAAEFFSVVEGNHALLAVLEIDETGESVMGTGFVWTGDPDTEEKGADDCLGWGSAIGSEFGFTGLTFITSFQSLHHEARSCSLPAHLYCVGP